MNIEEETEVPSDFDELEIAFVPRIGGTKKCPRPVRSDICVVPLLRFRKKVEEIIRGLDLACSDQEAFEKISDALVGKAIVYKTKLIVGQ